MSTCNMCEYEYESEYFIIAWVRVRVWVLVDEYEYEYRHMIYILYKEQYCIFQSLGNPQILINLRQSYNFPLPMQIPFVNIYLFKYSM